MGVGVGEVVFLLVVYLLIVDSFFFEKWVIVISVYLMGIYVGFGLVFLLGGVVIYFVLA